MATAMGLIPSKSSRPNSHHNCRPTASGGCQEVVNVASGNSSREIIRVGSWLPFSRTLEVESDTHLSLKIQHVSSSEFNMSINSASNDMFGATGVLGNFANITMAEETRLAHSLLHPQRPTSCASVLGAPGCCMSVSVQRGLHVVCGEDLIR